MWLGCLWSDLKLYSSKRDGMFLKDQILQVQQRVEDAATRAGRQPHEVLLLGISKYQSEEVIRAAFAGGVHSFGENYVQEALKKKEALADLDVDWHFTGHLQSNKARQVVGKFNLIHSLDRFSLAREVSKRAINSDVVQKVLVEVNLAGEESKSGVKLNDLPALIEQVLALPNVEMAGLMCMPPLSSDELITRAYFQQARELRDHFRAEYPELQSFRHLSMGTSSDFELAIEEGATIIRLGTVLLGARKY